ncbi:MAG: hypothetical protein AB1306_06035 [Nitrospirota bacterium]
MSKLRALFLALILLSAIAFIGANAEAVSGSAAVTGGKANGEFEVSVFKDGNWQKTESLPFDQFFSEKRIETGSSAAEGALRIKITQKGGHAAHIDSVLLDNMPPLEIKGTDDPLIMKKLSQKDFDVMDASGKEIELAFDSKEKASSLSISARIEGERISEAPFQYPLSNLYKKIDSKAKFYTYKLDAKEDDAKPFFKEYSVTGSGHPSGYTYGWVSNDRENLYVKIDFTPDNTMDGSKDYAKVNVKTEEGVKEFKVSVPETKWGKPDFTYTDKVSYQHKTYDFAIPFKELGINDAGKADEIQLAFSAYGTASPPGGDFGTASRQYLVVYEKYSGVSWDIYGQLVGEDGVAVGTEFVISNAANSQWGPSVAYNSSTNQYLVVWSDTRSGAPDIYGQLLNANGTLSGGNFPISTAANEQWGSSVAYNSSTNQYLVVWDDDRSVTNSDIYGQLVNANGTLSGGNFPISTAVNEQWGSSVAYNSSTNQYLVVWNDLRSGTNWDIYGQLLNANGSLSGGNFPISTAVNGQYIPSVAYNSSANQYLVVWDDYRSGTNLDIYGQLLNANGTLSGGDFPISTAAYNQWGSSATYNSSTNQYLIVWSDERNGINTDIYGQYLTGAGALTGGDFLIVNNAFGPHAVVNSIIGNYLVAYYDITGSAYAWVIVGEPVATPPPTPPPTCAYTMNMPTSPANIGTFAPGINMSYDPMVARPFGLEDAGDMLTGRLWLPCWRNGHADIYLVLDAPAYGGKFMLSELHQWLSFPANIQPWQTYTDDDVYAALFSLQKSGILPGNYKLDVIVVQSGTAASTIEQIVSGATAAPYYKWSFTETLP